MSPDRDTGGDQRLRKTNRQTDTQTGRPTGLQVDEGGEREREGQRVSVCALMSQSESESSAAETMMSIRFTPNVYKEFRWQIFPNPLTIAWGSGPGSPAAPALHLLRQHPAHSSRV